MSSFLIIEAFIKNVKVDKNVSNVVISVDYECEGNTDKCVVELEADLNKGSEIRDKNDEATSY